MPATNPNPPWEWKRNAPKAKATQLPSTGEGSRVKEAMERAHRSRTDVEIVVDTLITGGDQDDVRAAGWRSIDCNGHLEQRIWRSAMMADRGYVQTNGCYDNDPTTLATQIISQHLENSEPEILPRVTPNTHGRNRGGTRRATTAQNTAPPQDITHTTNTSPYTTTTNDSPPQASPQAPRDIWANLAGNAWMTGQQDIDGTERTPQCSLAAARNASRNGNLTELQFQRWCENGDILAPFWCDFLTDCCAGESEVAIPVDKATARSSGQSQIRVAVMQTNRGRHAITLITTGTGTFRRYDNDDIARREHNTFTLVTWENIMQEWDTLGVAMYAVVPEGAPLTRTQLVTAIQSRDARRRRVDELIRTGIHDASERSRILRAEDRHRRANTTPNPNQHVPADNRAQTNTTANPQLQPIALTAPQNTIHFRFPALDTLHAGQRHTPRTLQVTVPPSTQIDPNTTAASSQPDPSPHSHAQTQSCTTAQAQSTTAPRYAEDFHFPALRQQPSHHTPTARAHTTMPPSNTTTTTPTTRHRQPPHTIAHEHLQPSTTADREDHADQWGTNPTVGSTSRFEDGNHTKMHNASNADAHGKLHTFAIAAAGNHMDSRCARQPPNRLDHGERSYGNQCCTDDTSV